MMAAADNRGIPSRTTAPRGAVFACSKVFRRRQREASDGVRPPLFRSKNWRHWAGVRRAGLPGETGGDWREGMRQAGTSHTPPPPTPPGPLAGRSCLNGGDGYADARAPAMVRCLLPAVTPMSCPLSQWACSGMRAVHSPCSRTMAAPRRTHMPCMRWLCCT